MRCATVLLAGLLAAGPAAAAPVRLGAGTPHAIAVTSGQAWVVVDSGRADKPFELVRSGGSSVVRLGAFGSRQTEFPDVAADSGGRVVAAWEQPVSAGVAIFGQAVAATLNPPSQLALATGPGRIAVGDDGSAILAFPDRTGDSALATTPDFARPLRGERDPYALPRTTTNSSDAPARRHLPLDVVTTPVGTFVLDLVQIRGGSRLFVEGPGAPPAAVLAVGGLHQLQGAFATDGATIAVAYALKGRVVLATATAGAASWSRRTLPGPKRSAPVTSTPAVVLVDGRPFVVYAQRPAKDRPRDLYLARGSSRTRLTHTRADEAGPLAAAGAAGSGPAWLAYSRRGRGGRVPLLERIP